MIDLATLIGAWLKDNNHDAWFVLPGIEGLPACLAYRHIDRLSKQEEIYRIEDDYIAVWCTCARCSRELALSMKASDPQFFDKLLTQMQTVEKRYSYSKSR